MSVKINQKCRIKISFDEVQNKPYLCQPLIYIMYNTMDIV